MSELKEEIKTAADAGAKAIAELISEWRTEGMMSEMTSWEMAMNLNTACLTASGLPAALERVKAAREAAIDECCNALCIIDAEMLSGDTAINMAIVALHKLKSRSQP